MNYFVDSPANYFNSNNSNSMNEFYPAAQQAMQQSSVAIQNQINPMT